MNTVSVCVCSCSCIYIIVCVLCVRVYLYCVLCIVSVLEENILGVMNRCGIVCECGGEY